MVNLQDPKSGTAADLCAMKRFLNHLFATGARRPARNERRHRPQFRLEALEDRTVPTVYRSGLGQVILEENAFNNFNIDVRGSDLVVTDNGQENSFPLNTVNSVGVIFHHGGSINIERNAGKDVSIGVLGGIADIDVCKTSKFLDNVRGHIAIGARGGNYNLTLNDQANGFADTYTLMNVYMLTGQGFETTQSISRPFSATVSLEGAPAHAVSLGSGSGAATFNVDSTQAWSTRIDTGGGGDTVNVGSSGTLDRIQGALIVNGGGAALLELNDSAATAGHTYDIDRWSVRRSGAAPVSYEAVGGLSIRGGTGGDSFNVASVRGKLFLDGGAGVDRLRAPGDTWNSWNLGRIDVSPQGQHLADIYYWSVEAFENVVFPTRKVSPDGTIVPVSIYS